MKNQDILIEVAKRSPKTWATTIRRRNQALLTHLEKMHKRVVKQWDNLNFEQTVNLGCPHCIHDFYNGFDCENCLWTKVVDKNKYFGCCRVKFNGVTLDKASNNRNLPSIRNRYEGFRISYSSNSASVFYNYTSKEMMEKTYKACKKFLEGHIEWTHMECWGEKSQSKKNAKS